MHIDDLLLRIRRLPVAKLAKLEEMVRVLEENQPGTASATTGAETAPSISRRSVRGLLRDLGPAPSNDEIDRARHDLWAGFPREDLS